MSMQPFEVAVKLGHAALAHGPFPVMTRPAPRPYPLHGAGVPGAAVDARVAAPA